MGSRRQDYVKDDNVPGTQVATHQQVRQITLSSKCLALTPPTRHTRFTTQVKAVAITKLLSLLLKVKQSQILQLTSVQQAIAVWQQQLKTGKQQFAFTLDHKAAYLLFLPRTSNTILHNCYLTKVEVNSDNDITSTYTLDPTTGKLIGTGTGKQIVLTTKGSGTYSNGFPLTNNATSAATNGSYVVIKPGTHTLKIRYWVKEIATGTEGTITKTLSSATYDQNKYYNITANLDVTNYDGDHYYMWDAQQNYWAGHEWNSANPWQPTLTTQQANSNYPQSNTDVRYYNESYPGYGISNPATHSCATLPNANEVSWYCMYGDPRLGRRRTMDNYGSFI